MPSNDEKTEDENPNDIICTILKGSAFKIKSNEEKLGIIRRGRPLPKLSIIKRDTSKNCNRTFQSSWYTIHKWLSGSVRYNKLFCWPCLLMRPETSSWCSTGNDDMKRFTTLATKHALSKSHLKAISEYDDILTGFGLPPEFVDELNFKCKEEVYISDQTEPEDEVVSLFVKDEEKNKKNTLENKNTQINPSPLENVGKKKSPEPSKVRTKITFKSWQEMSRDSIYTSKSFEDSKLYKWKRKLVRQELKNARLAGEKLKYEIEVLKAKAEYYKGLKENSCENSESSVQLRTNLRTKAEYYKALKENPCENSETSEQGCFVNIESQIGEMTP